MQRAISTILSGLVLSTLIATSATLAVTPKAHAAEQQPSTANMTVNDTQMVDLERAYIEKYGS
ncbi:MAG: hypothetical protein NW220_12020 [Leptolyngbyaceae cyanobacterium bins.349]|nr:hypothetical protein [Leptolyngbyaceae cyanobacterium bins.349]